MRSMRRGATLAAVLAAVMASACGGGDDGGQNSNADRFGAAEKEVAAVIDRLGEAARRGDTKTICEDLVTIQLQKSVRETSKSSCAEEFRKNLVTDDASFEVKSVEVTGRQATAVVVDQQDRESTLAFSRVGDDWRIANID